ncbi:hypothetical protein RFI_39813, partial [Reticulomyxa filosa]
TTSHKLGYIIVINNKKTKKKKRLENNIKKINSKAGNKHTIKFKLLWGKKKTLLTSKKATKTEILIFWSALNESLLILYLIDIIASKQKQDSKNK